MQIITKHSSENIFFIPKEATLENAQIIKNELVDILATCENPIFDLSHIYYIDSTFIQMILSIKKDNEKIEFINPSDVVVDVLLLLNINI